MPYSTESVECKVFETQEEAEKHGKGGIWYEWYTGTNKEFPRDVSRVHILMPTNDSDSFRWLPWEVSRWELSGTYDKPTLRPSLHWVDGWHGWLNNGSLESC